MSVSTGTQLDRKIGEGFPKGSIITITAPWASNAERFLHQVIEENDQQCFYISTEQNKPVISEIFDNSKLITSSQPTIIESTDNSRPIPAIEEKIESVPDGCLVIIDSINSLEVQDKRDYQSLLNHIQEEISDTETSVFLFGSFDNTEKPSNRRRTFKMSDVVMRFTINYQSGNVDTFIDIPKFRGNDEIDERIKIVLDESEVEIDTSRAVA